jgi:hypothetical protein
MKDEGKVSSYISVIVLSAAITILILIFLKVCLHTRKLKSEKTD